MSGRSGLLSKSVTEDWLWVTWAWSIGICIYFQITYDTTSFVRKLDMYVVMVRAPTILHPYFWAIYRLLEVRYIAIYIYLGLCQRITWFPNILKYIIAGLWLTLRRQLVLKDLLQWWRCFVISIDMVLKLILKLGQAELEAELESLMEQVPKPVENQEIYCLCDTCLI